MSEVSHLMDTGCVFEMKAKTSGLFSISRLLTDSSACKFHVACTCVLACFGLFFSFAGEMCPSGSVAVKVDLVCRHLSDRNWC